MRAPVAKKTPAKPGRKRSPTGGEIRARRLRLLLVVIAVLLGLLVAFLPRAVQAPIQTPTQISEPAEPRAPAQVETPSETSGPSVETPPAVGPVAVEPVQLAIVIDDVGYDATELTPFLALPGPVTFAVIPGLSGSTRAAERIYQAGKQVIVHMPMEPLGGADPGPGAILTTDDDAEVHRRLAAAFATVPHAVGMNNHMGSRAVSDPRIMNAVMTYLAENDLLFLDSRTTADSVGFRMADLHDVSFAERSVFLDNETADQSVEAQLREGLAVAVGRGQALLIGHVHSPATARVLARYLPVLEAKGFQLTPLMSYVDP